MWNPLRRMREDAYKRGYVDAMVDLVKEDASQIASAHRPTPRPAVPEFEDPFLASDWRQITDGG